MAKKKIKQKVIKTTNIKCLLGCKKGECKNSYRKVINGLDTIICKETFNVVKYRKVENVDKNLVYTPTS